MKSTQHFNRFLAYSETEEQLSDIEHLAELAQQLHKTSVKLSHAVVTFKIE